MTTIVENSRRTIYAIIRGSTPRVGKSLSLSLLDVPHERDRRDDDAAQIRTVGRRKNELRCGYVGNELEGASLHRIGCLFRSCRIGCGKPDVAQFLDLRVVRPPEPALLTRAADREIDRRVREIRTDQPRMENRPTAFFHRLLGRAARD